jgi:hypothetical protein
VTTKLHSGRGYLLFESGLFASPTPDGYDTRHLWPHTHVNVWGHNLVPFDLLFPFRPRSVIISHRVISRTFDTFHFFLAQCIPFLLQSEPNLEARSHSRPHPSREPRRWEASGSPLPSTAFPTRPQSSLFFTLHPTWLRIGISAQALAAWHSQVAMHNTRVRGIHAYPN